MGDERFEALLQEYRSFNPKQEFIANANIKSKEIYKMGEDYLALWKEQAQRLTWYEPWSEVCEWEAPFAHWFTNGKLNAAYNCIDRHINSWRKNKAAIIFEGENGDQRVLTYQDLFREVSKFANCLKKLGVEKGDRVTIYMPMIPEAIIAMLACARIGAPHSVVFGGFSSDALKDRINDAQSKVVITSDGSFRKGKIIPLKANADEALKDTISVEHLIVVNRTGLEVQMQDGRDYWYHELLQNADHDCPPTVIDSEDPLFILYTSGTTGKPKGVVHTTGGYLVGVSSTHEWVFDLKENDIYWCTADIGWITGHSYLVYGPLANGATILLFEGTPDYPQKDRFWQIIEKYAVTILYTAPTAIRTFMKWGPTYPQSHNLSSLRLLGTVGEPINPEAWMWYYKYIGGEQCPIVDTWWQTETGMIMMSPLPGVTMLKPGSCSGPLPGVKVDVVDRNGKPVPNGRGGYLVVREPWPSMLKTIYGDNERYVNSYWNNWPGIYFTGDGARRDGEGNIWVLGRVDDVINVSGHRIGTMEIESALVDHPLVAEAACIGKTHEVKGQAISAFVTLREGIQVRDELVDELKTHVAKKIGALARPDDIFISAELPKTRSGKIMRRLLRDIAEGRAVGDTTTLADSSVIQSLMTGYKD